MRSTTPLPTQGALQRLASLVARGLAYVGCAGAIVAATHLLSADKEPVTPTPTAAAVTQADERGTAAQVSPASSGGGPRVVYAGPPIRSAPPFRGTKATSSGGTAGARSSEGAARADPVPDVPSTPAVVVVAVTRGAVSPAELTESRVGRVPESAVAGPTSSPSGVDLNTASLGELNALPGAGLIGRAIIRSRPYTSPENLLTKRVINKATYQLIKDQVRTQ